jgi:hypothetical protein
MRTLVFIIFSTLFINGNCQLCQHQEVSPQLLEAYDFDVSQLAIKRIYETNSPYQDSISIPSVIKDTIWEGLNAVFNSFSIPERDSIFDIYCIHDYNCNAKPVQMVLVVVDTQYSWLDKWKQGETQTGYEELDEFLSIYNFRQYWVGYACLETETVINLPPFLDSLKKFNGIVDAVDYTAGSCCHDKIGYSISDALRYYTFELGFGPAQFYCLNTFTWEFQVDQECRVELTQSKHLIRDPNSYPNEVIENCKITSIKQKADFNMDLPININPNPAKDVVCLSTESALKYKITIHDMQGRKLYDNIFHQELKISVLDYCSGVYIVSLYEEGHRNLQNIKLIIE